MFLSQLQETIEEVKSAVVREIPQCWGNLLESWPDLFDYNTLLMTSVILVFALRIMFNLDFSVYAL